jgi:hypothetical protein
MRSTRAPCGERSGRAFCTRTLSTDRQTPGFAVTPRRYGRRTEWKCPTHRTVTAERDATICPVLLRRTIAGHALCHAETKLEQIAASWIAESRSAAPQGRSGDRAIGAD